MSMVATAHAPRQRDQRSFRSFISITLGGAIIATVSAGLGAIS